MTTTTTVRAPIRRDGSSVIHLADATVSEWRGWQTYDWTTGTTECGRRITAEWSVPVAPAIATCKRCRTN